MLKNPFTLKGQRFSYLVGPAAIASSIAVLLAFGVFGIGRKDGNGADFDWFYIAGKIWLGHQNPYDFQTFTSLFQQTKGYANDVPFSYPPQFAPVSMLFALLDYSHARIAIVLLNLLAVSLLALLTMRLVTDAEVPRPASHMPITRWLLPCLIIANPFTTNLVWLGQVTLVAGALLVGAWYFARRDKSVLAGLLLGLSTFKPQLIVLPALWLFLDRRWKVLAVAAIVSLLLASYSFMTLGPVSAIRDWLQALSMYQSGDTTNNLGSNYVVGLPSALVAAGLHMPGPFLLIFGGAGLTVLFWLGRSRLCADDILGILVAIQFSLIYAKDSEMVLLAPLLSGLWLHIGHRRKLWVVVVVALLVLFFPQRFVRQLNEPVLNHWRTLIILYGFFALVFLSWRQGQRLRRQQQTLQPERQKV